MVSGGGGDWVVVRPLLFWHETAMNTSALQTRLQGKQSNDDGVVLFVFVCEIYIYCLHYAAAAAPEKIASSGRWLSAWWRLLWPMDDSSGSGSISLNELQPDHD